MKLADERAVVLDEEDEDGCGCFIEDMIFYFFPRL
jgi:hypothetical protein